MQNFGRENFDDSTCIRQNSSDFSTVKVLRYTVYTCKGSDLMELDEHQHRGPEVTLQQCLRESVQ